MRDHTIFQELEGKRVEIFTESTRTFVGLLKFDLHKKLLIVSPTEVDYGVGLWVSTVIDQDAVVAIRELTAVVEDENKQAQLWSDDDSKEESIG